MTDGTTLVEDPAEITFPWGLTDDGDGTVTVPKPPGPSGPPVDGFVPLAERNQQSNTAADPYACVAYRDFGAIAYRTANTIEVIDFIDRTTPSVTSLSLVSGSTPEHLVRVGNYLFAACDSGHLISVEAANYGAGASIVAETQIDANISNANGLAVIDKDTLAFATVGAGTVLIDVTDPAAPTVLGSYNSHAFAPQGVHYIGDGYLGVSLDPLDILDISDPTAPTLAGQIANGLGDDDDLFQHYNYPDKLYCFYGTTGELFQMDVSDPTAPVWEGLVYTITLSDAAIELHGDYLYSTDGGTVSVDNVETWGAGKEIASLSTSLTASWQMSVDPKAGTILVTDNTSSWVNIG